MNRNIRIVSVKDNFKAFLVEGAVFVSKEQYPRIESWMIPEDLEDLKVIPFDHLCEVEDKIEEYYICFYCGDDKFMKVYNNPMKYVKLFRRSKGIIGFDFSPLSDMPIIKQKEQMNKNLSLMFYYGMRYVSVIPNLRCGNDCTIDDYLEAIPRNCLIAIGTYGCVQSKKEQFRYKSFLQKVLPVLNPIGVIVYGAMPKFVFDEFDGMYNFYHCTPYICGVWENKNERN